MAFPTVPATCANVAGPVAVWVDSGVANAVEFLGYTTNGLSIEEQQFQAPVHSDSAGGEQGPPIDYQQFGLQHRIQMEFTQYAETILSKLSLRYNPNIDNANIGVGMLLVCGSGTWRFIFKGPNFIRNYPICVLEGPIERSPIGSQHTRARISIISNAIAGALPWNTTVPA